MSDDVKLAAQRLIHEQPRLLPAFFRRDCETVARFALDAAAEREAREQDVARLRGALASALEDLERGDELSALDTMRAALSAASQEPAAASVPPDHEGDGVPGVE